MTRRLLIVSSEYPPGPGGIGTHAYQLANNLRERSWDVMVLAQQDHASHREIAAFSGTEPYPMERLAPGRFALEKAYRRWADIRKALRAFSPQVVLASGKRVVLLTAAAAPPVPWVAIGHGAEFGSINAADRALTRWAYHRADEVICVSSYTERRMRAMNIHARRHCVIHNGADATRFRKLPENEIEAFRTRLGLNGSPTLATVGRVCERKGQDVVIRALPRIHKQVPDVHYVVAGLPEERTAFEHLAQSLGVSRYVHFLGRVDDEDLVRVQNICDVFLMTSRHSHDGDFEGYGIAVVEAALCGKPAVVAANSGLVEAIDDGSTGLVVPEDDEEAVASAVASLLVDEQNRQHMGNVARSQALASKTWEHRAAEYDRVLREHVT